MMEQISLFDSFNKSIYERIQDLLDDIISDHNLPPKSIHLYSNISTKSEKGGSETSKETSKSICIFEPEYPPRKNISENPGRNYVIMNFKLTKDNYLELLIRNRQFDAIDTPQSALVKTLKSDKSFVHVFFEIKDDALFKYIRANILYCLSNYESTSSFACCSLFMQCSDSLKCVHENRIYAMGCKYRRNLEAGRIFFGKNKNIECKSEN